MAVPVHKICSKCNEEKPLGDFYKNRTKKYGVCSECKDCTNKMNRGYVKHNRQKYLNYQKKYHQKHLIQHRNQNLKQSYGMTPEDWEDLFDNQKGRCAVCGAHQSELKRRLDVDHNHTTGEVRALLCSRCNTLIGQAKEDVELLGLIISYLEEHNG